MLMDDIGDELVDLGLSTDDVLAITTELNRKYRFTQNIQGFDFLRKAKISTHSQALLKALEGNLELTNKLLKGSKNNIKTLINTE